MKITRSYSTKKWIDKQALTFILVSLLILYLLPTNYLVNISFISDYVSWVMNTFRLLDVVATRSDDYASYAVYFVSLPVLIIVYAVIYYKKPIKLKIDIINNNKIYYFFILTFFVPFIVVGIIVSLTYWEEDFTFILVETMVLISSSNKVGLILIFGGICIALSYLLAGYMTWSKYVLRQLSDVDGCGKTCSIIYSSISLLVIVAYVVSLISLYNDLASILIDSLAGDSSAGRMIIIFILSGFIIITTFFITACFVIWEHGVNLVTLRKRREQ